MTFSLLAGAAALAAAFPIGCQARAADPASGSAASVSSAVAHAKDDLFIARDGRTDAIILVSPGAPASAPASAGMPATPGSAERLAAADLARYIGLMCGATPAVADTDAAIDAALKSGAPLLVVGSQAIKLQPALAARLAKAAKPNPTLRSDAVAVVRDGNRVYLAGNNDDSHYYAVAHLLRLWGCRWYTPTEFGECIPARPTLAVGNVDYVYGSPFEVRKYWISWNGDNAGAAEFKRRNMLNEIHVPNGHNLATFTKDLVPAGMTVFNVPIADPATAKHVADKVADQFGRGQDVQLGMEDGIYASDSPVDKELNQLQFDKYYMLPAMTDSFMVFYNGVADALTKAHPASKAHIGFLIYSNITLPPVRPCVGAKPLVGYLAPIDFDPIHGMDDPQSPPRQEYRDILYKWAKIMQGRVVIYDYDQSMLVWRDFPNPSHQAFRHDVKHYLQAGILGVDVESRNAIGTTFLNLHIRSRLMWDPNTDVDALLEEFYPAFYGPAGPPMKAYWSAIYDAWSSTIVTEHEQFVAPAIYTPQLIDTMRKNIMAAESAIQPLTTKPNATRNEKQYVERVRFTRLSFDIADAYLAMVRAAATDGDYAAAVKFGKEGLAARDALTKMNGTFTTYLHMPEGGPAWWPGEVQQYADLLTFTDGTKGKLVAKLPLEWSFHRDPKRIGDKEGYATQHVDLTFWKANNAKYTLDTLKDYPVDQWEVLRGDLYAQAQGVRSPDRQSYLGWMWYRTDITVPPDQAAKPIHIRFPGVLCESWLYVNGQEVAHRPQGKLWWLNDYKFEWDIDLTGKLQPGVNNITVKLDDVHHWGGLFRRPFLYAPVGAVGDKKAAE
jgi:hypothetical protein